jgi:hypothetical protein
VKPDLQVQEVFTRHRTRDLACGRTNLRLRHSMDAALTHSQGERCRRKARRGASTPELPTRRTRPWQSLGLVYRPPGKYLDRVRFLPASEAPGVGRTKARNAAPS